MANNNKEKKGIFSWGVSAIKWKRILVNPITWYFLIGLFIILLLMGIIAFISALPGAISEKFTQMITDLIGENYATYGVEEQEILDMAIYLDQMGYDLENYGFVEEITREPNIQDGNYINNQPSHGKIISVKSKYLEAYIGEEKKIYKIAPENYTTTEMTEDYYLQKAINKYVSNDENLEIYYYYQIKGTDITKLSKETQEKYEEGRTRAEQNVNLAKQITDEYNASLTGIKDANGLLTNQEGRTRLIGAGMIVLTGKAKEENYKDWKWIRKVFGKEVNYEFRVDEEARKLILTVSYIPENATFWDQLKMILGIESSGKEYGVDLESFLSKYGKPSEFTLAFHLATQAPDFVYKLATSSNTDTKVYLDMWPKTINYIAVTDSGSEARLDTLLNSINTNSDVHQRYVSELENYSGELIEGRQEKLYDYYLNSGNFFNINPEAYKAQATRWYNDMIEKLKGTTYMSVEAVINAIKTEILASGRSYNIEEWEIIDIQGVNCSFNDLKELIDMFPSFNKTINTATPYITKVVQHWYRNQYFINQDKELNKAKTVATSFLDNIRYRINTQLTNSAEQQELLQKVESYKEGINKIGEGESFDLTTENLTDVVEEYIADVCTQLEAAYKDISGYIKDETSKQIIDAFFETKLNSLESRYGTTYEIIEVEDKYHSLASFNGSSRANVNEVISKSYYREVSTPDIIQIHNPVFSDNSKYVRSWFKDKYIIYDGVTRTEEERILGAKKYIQGKTALDSLYAMLQKATTEADNLKYMQRDVAEFMQDFSFDLNEIEETTAEKNLVNIMPEYVPYTPWPSQYEQADSIWTKMTFKTSNSTRLVAPADCIITKVGEIYELGILNSDGLVSEYVYLCADEDSNGNKITDLNITEGEYKQNEQIGTATPREGTNLAAKTISIKLQMLTGTKQKIDITTRMNVRSKTIDEITQDEEAVMVAVMSAVTYYGFNDRPHSSEIEKVRDLYEQECLAMISTAINRIQSPYCKDTSLSHIDYVEMGVINLNGFEIKDGQLVSDESKRKSNPIEILTQEGVRNLIKLALRGTDKTEEGTILGATVYRKIWENDLYIENQQEGSTQEDVKTIDTELADVNLKMAIGGGGFYIPNNQYKLYEKFYVNDKIRSIFVQLNEQKDELNEQKGYTAGYGKYKISRTENPEEDLLKIFNYVEDTIYGLAEDTCITSIIITQINEEINEEEQFIDTFRLKVNSNVTFDITIKYNCTPEGKILYDSMTYEVEEIERL